MSAVAEWRDPGSVRTQVSGSSGWKTTSTASPTARSLSCGRPAVPTSHEPGRPMNGDRDADLPDCPLPGPCRGRPSSFADYRLVATRAPWDNDRSPGDPPLTTSAFPVAVCSAIARPRPPVLDPAYAPAVRRVGRPPR